MSETCQNCGQTYSTIYRVPNAVWARIAPNKASLGDFPEHQFGGLLCVPCADAAARHFGIVLYWEAAAGDWQGNQIAELQAENERLSETCSVLVKKMEEVGMCQLETLRAREVLGSCNAYRSNQPEE